MRGITPSRALAFPRYLSLSRSLCCGLSVAVSLLRSLYCAWLRMSLQRRGKTLFAIVQWDAMVSSVVGPPSPLSGSLFCRRRRRLRCGAQAFGVIWEEVRTFHTGHLYLASASSEEKKEPPIGVCVCVCAS